MERRVWYGSSGREVFLNVFIALVGRPGVGKSFVLSEIRNILRQIRDPERGTVIENRAMVPAPAFNIGPDTVTFEAMIADMCRLSKAFKLDGRMHAQAPYLLLLSELNSFIREYNEQIPKALLKFFDCEDYDYLTKGGGMETVKRSAVTIIGGATMDFIHDAYKKNIFDNGFSSRFLWIFDNQKRPSSFEVCELSAEQLASRQAVIDWCKALYKVAGKLSYDNDTKAYLEHWKDKVHEPAEEQAPEYMQHYMARKPIYLRKLAGCIHFSRNMDLTLTRQDFDDALALLSRIETGLVAFTTVGRNPMAAVQRKLLATLKQHKEGLDEGGIMCRHMSDLNLEELRQCIEVMKLTGQISVKIVKNKDTYYAKS